MEWTNEWMKCVCVRLYKKRQHWNCEESERKENKMIYNTHIYIRVNAVRLNISSGQSSNTEKAKVNLNLETERERECMTKKIGLCFTGFPFQLPRWKKKRESWRSYLDFLDFFITRRHNSIKKIESPNEKSNKKKHHRLALWFCCIFTWKELFRRYVGGEAHT